VPITVGFENGVQVPSTVKATFTVINQKWFWVFVISSVTAIALFWWLAYKCDIIRDTGPQPEGMNEKGKPNRKTYSLARTQMAFWFFIVIISYVFIWMVTSDLSNLTASVLGLIGISAATGLGSAVVDSSKQSEQENQHRILEEKKKSDEVEAERLQSEIITRDKAINATPAPTNLEEQKAGLRSKQAELAAKQKEIEQTTQKIQEVTAAAKPAASKHFINDILSDGDGVSFYRFQIFAWTIALILIFIASVYNTLAMPDFDAMLLGLMGISGGTYIGFKLPAQQG
jgi:magnesium-transporting ATPase (P-type)